MLSKVYSDLWDPWLGKKTALLLSVVSLSPCVVIKRPLYASPMEISEFTKAESEWLNTSQ